MSVLTFDIDEALEQARAASEEYDRNAPVPQETDEEPDIRLGRVLVRGNKMHARVQAAITSATLSWAIGEVTQLAITVEDPGFEVWKSALFEKGTKVVYREDNMDDIVLRVVGLELGAGSAGTGAFTANCRSEGAQALKRLRGAHVMRKCSPTEFVKAECKKAGLKFVGQSSPTRKQVARDVATKGDAPEQGSTKPSAWTTIGRLATELGFYAFEFGGTLYFGKPTWLIEKDKKPVNVALPLKGAPGAWVAHQIPNISQSEDGDVPVTVDGILLPRHRFVESRPGKALRLRGLPPFTDELLITSMSMPLMGEGPLELAAATPKNPEPQPPAKPVSSSGGGDYDDSEGGGATQTGTRSALDFVTMAISASNAAYVYGAEASTSDATPSALDCSELVQWALGRVGVPFVDGSANQIAAANGISVASAIATRGALLYMPGHIGISMGDGRSVEARNPSAGVGIFRAADINWTQGGLVPGLRYG